MSFDEIREPVEAWRRAGRRYGVAVLTGTWRSAPRRPGARFVRSDDGEIAGNVSAGCVEADLAERLDAVLGGEPPDTVTYEVSDETARGVGLSCGGRIDVFLAARAPDDPIFPALLRRIDERDRAILVTDLDRAAGGAGWLLAPDGKILAADAAGPPPEGAVAAGRRLLHTGGVAVLEEAGRKLLVEAVLPPRRLVVVGATPVGAALARLARAAAIPVTVVEPRPAYAHSLSASGIPVDERWPDDALRDLGLDRSTAVAVVAHDDRLDVAALETALSGDAGYVGLLGGGRTRRRRFEALEAAGVAPERLEAVHAPIGLDLGAELPAEIAISILAEIVHDWRGAQ